jgi:uncharacterized lipoprotein YehR (DUF1307 family)
MYLDPSYVINPQYFEEVKSILICTFCTGIIYDPIECNKCQNNFCKICLEKWSENQIKCPLRCKAPKFHQENRLIRNLLAKVMLLCPAGCLQKFYYEDYIKHTQTCNSKTVNLFNFERLEKEVETMKIEHAKLLSTNKILSDKLFHIKTAHQKELESYKEKIEFLEYRLGLLEQKKPDIKINPLERKIDNNEDKHSIKNTAPGLKVIVKECENYEWTYYPLCDVCHIAFPCPECHNLKENHECQFEKVLCNKCFSVNSKHNFKCINDNCTNLIEISD